VRLFCAAALGGLIFWLGSGSALATDPLFIGRWSLDPAGCRGAGSTAQTTPLVVGERSVEWYRSSCAVKKSYRIGDGLYLQAECFSGGKARVMPIGLQLHGSKLRVTWNQTLAGEMQRCR